GGGPAALHGGLRGGHRRREQPRAGGAREPGRPVAAQPRRAEERSVTSPKGCITPEFTFWCGACVAWERFSEDAARRAAAKTARRRGWRLTRGRGWICPSCARGE